MRLFSIGLILGASIVLAAAACPSEPPALDRIPPGDWGGEHVFLQVTDSVTTIEYDCAHGLIRGPMRVNARGAFSLDGVYVREHGGPIREGELADSLSARYTGVTDGATMSFTVTVIDGSVGPFEFKARRGESARVFKCL
jgi:hypothetical protein